MRGNRNQSWACVSLVLFLLLGPATGAALAAGKPFEAPVNAEVVRHFEPPSHRFGPGHRGIDYGVPSGTSVKASGSGTVSFAGRVANDGLFVTIEHVGGIATTYSFLSRTDVAKGDRVTKGQVIGASGEGHPGGPPLLHFGAKKNGEYIDPEILLRDLDDITNILQLTPVGERKRTERISISPAMSPRFVADHGATDSFRPSDPTTNPVSGSDGTDGTSSELVGKSDSGNDATPPPLSNDSGLSQPLGFKPPGLGILELPSGPIGTRLAEARTKLPMPPKLDGAPAAIKKANPRRKSRLGFKEQMAKWADNIGDFNLKFADAPVLALFAPPVGGAFKEAACLLRGGGEAPIFYPETELQRGIRYGRPGGTKVPKPAPNDHVVIAVAGITTQTEDAGQMSALYQSSWWEDLGFRKEDVYFYSYEGTPRSSGKKTERGSSFDFHEPYSVDDTYQSIEDSALKLSKQIKAIQRAHPGRKIDIVAHSQGGAVSQYYLTNLYRPERAPLNGSNTGPSIGKFVSISSPHLGTPGASGYAILADSWHGQTTYPGLEKTAGQIGLPKGSAESSMQLNPDSDFIKDAVRDWDPNKVDTTTIATPMDIAVVPQYTRLEGAQHYTVWIDPFDAKPWGHHGTVVGMPETKAIIYNALRGTPSRCTGFMNAIADEVTGDAIGHTESGLLKGVDLFMNFPWH